MFPKLATNIFMAWHDMPFRHWSKLYKEQNSLYKYSLDTKKWVSNFLVKLSVKENAKPKIFKRGPLAYGATTNETLDNSVKQEFIEQVKHIISMIIYYDKFMI